MPANERVTTARNRVPDWTLWSGAVLSAAAYGVISAVYGGKLAVILFLPLFPMVWILRDMRVGLVCLILLFPFQHTPFLPQFTGFNMVNYCLFASLISFLSVQFFRPRPVAPFPAILLWCYLAPIVLATILGAAHLDAVPIAVVQGGGIYYRSVHEYAIGMVLKPLLVVLAAWLLGCAVLWSKKPERFLAVLVAATVLPAVSILGFVANNGFDLKILANVRARETLGELGLHANEFGLLLGTGFSICLFLWPALQTTRARIAHGLALALVTAGLLLTFSRGAFVGAGLAIVCFAISYKQLRYIGMTAVLVLGVAALAPDAFLGRIMTGLDGQPAHELAHNSDDALTAGRVWIWNQVLPDFLKHPFVGTGIGAMAWSDAVLRGVVHQVHPHNLYLRILLDMGLVGLILLAVFVHDLLRQCKTIARDSEVPTHFQALAQGTRVAILGMLVSGWANGKYLPDSELTILWMAIGMLLPFMGKRARPR